MSEIKNIKFEEGARGNATVSDLKKTKPAPQNAPAQDEEQHPKKRRSWFKICCCSCIVLLIIFVLGVTSAIASTGLVYIPGFSQLFYHEPKPTRVVKTLDKNKIEDIIQKKIEEQVQNSGKKVVEVEFSEEEITTLMNMQKLIAGNLQDLQLVVEKDYLELYGKITSPVHTVFILKVTPKVKNDQVYLNPESLKVGALRVPIDWALKISNLDEMIKKPIQISNDIKIKSLTLEKKKIKATIEVLNVEESTQYVPSGQSTLAPEST
jgi:hypothetical protein